MNLRALWLFEVGIAIHSTAEETVAQKADSYARSV